MSHLPLDISNLFAIPILLDLRDMRVVLLLTERSWLPLNQVALSQQLFLRYHSH